MVKKPARTLNLIEKEIDGELLVYDKSGRSVHVLNKTAAFIYNLCDGNHSLMDIIAKTGENFQGPDELSDDVEKIIEDFYQLQLVKEE